MWNDWFRNKLYEDACHAESIRAMSSTPLSYNINFSFYCTELTEVLIIVCGGLQIKNYKAKGT